MALFLVETLDRGTVFDDGHHDIAVVRDWLLWSS